MGEVFKYRTWMYHATEEARIFEVGEDIDTLIKAWWVDHPNKVKKNTSISTKKAKKTDEVNDIPFISVKEEYPVISKSVPGSEKKRKSWLE